MVAAVLISIGFLAVGQMQVQGLRFSQSAYISSQAGFMLKDMTDRMRSNRAGVLNGDYDDLSTASGIDMPVCVTTEVPCTPAELAVKDIAQWSSYLHATSGVANFTALLPSGGSNTAGGSITKNGTAYDVAVQWNERVGAADVLKSLTVKYIP